MATTKLWAIHSHLNYLVDYAANAEKTQNPLCDDLRAALCYAEDDVKTEQRYFVTGINCATNGEDAFERMNAAYSLSGRPVRVLGYHGYQSFSAGEVDAKTAHEIGVKLARELWGDKFVVVVATHLNTGHYHNHFVFGSTSFVDGSRYHCCTASYRRMREVSDRLCREYGLSVIDAPEGKSKSYAERTAERDGKPTYSSLVRADIDLAISQSYIMRHFFIAMEAMGYEIKQGKYLAVRAKGAERFRRLKTLGEDYTEAAILRRILANRSCNEPYSEQMNRDLRFRFRGTFKPHARLSGLRALYYHYLYKLCILPQQKQSGRRAPALLREDIVKLDSIIEQNRFLHKYKLDTAEQLAEHRASTKQQLAIFDTARGQLRTKLKRVLSPEERERTRLEINSITTQMRELRREVKLCGTVEERSAVMQEKLRVLAEAERENKPKRIKSRPRNADGR